MGLLIGSIFAPWHAWAQARWARFLVACRTGESAEEFCGTALYTLPETDLFIVMIFGSISRVTCCTGRLPQIVLINTAEVMSGRMLRHFRPIGRPVISCCVRFWSFGNILKSILLSWILHILYQNAMWRLVNFIWQTNCTQLYTQHFRVSLLSRWIISCLDIHN